MLVLEREKLFGNLKKSAFFTHEVTFLCYIITGDGIKADQRKIGGYSVLAYSSKYT